MPAYYIAGHIDESNTGSLVAENEIGLLLTSMELMNAPENDPLCQKLKELLKKDGSMTVEKDGLLCRKAPTYGAIQITVPERYRRTLLYQGHCPTLAGNQGTKRTYNVLRRIYFWLHMPFDVHDVVF